MIDGFHQLTLYNTPKGGSFVPPRGVAVTLDHKHVENNEMK